jgi:multiple sugar transport system permease protein
VGLAYLFLLPTFVLVVGLIIYPFLRALYLSLTDKLVGYPERFVGLQNYLYLARDASFHQVVANSLIFTAGSVSLKVLTGIFMAVVLNQAIRGRAFFRGLFLVPWITSTVIIALTWRWMFDSFPGRGFFNSILLDLHILHEPLAFLGTGPGAMAAVIVANWWRGFPFFGVVFLAGLQAVPRDLYEAAAVDGANAVQRFIHVTLPGITHIVLVATLLTTIWTLNDFNIVYVMTRGGPGSATHVFATYTYETGFNQLRWGRAVAISMYSLPVLAAVIAFLARRLLREEAT